MVRKMLESRELAKLATPQWIRELIEGDESIDFDSPDFSWRETTEYVYREAGLREAEPAGALAFLQRAQTQRVADRYYNEEQAGYAWKDVCDVVTSDKFGEFYTPLMTAETPNLTIAGDPFTETNIVGLDIFLRNYKFMGGVSIPRELFDDDMTGQLPRFQARLGQAQARAEEIYWSYRMAGTAGQYGRLVVPASNWTAFPTARNALGNTVTGIFTVAGTNGLGNRVATLTPLSTSALKEAEALLDAMLDGNGNKMGYMADTLVVSSADRRNAAMMMHSSYYPAVPGRTIAGVPETAANVVGTFPGGAFTDNPWKGSLKIVVGRYLPLWACYVGVGHQGLVHQKRDPLEVVQEVPNSGAGFQTDTIRFRSRARWETDWVDPRPWIQVNDGTVTGSY